MLMFRTFLVVVLTAASPASLSFAEPPAKAPDAKAPDAKAPDAKAPARKVDKPAGDKKAGAPAKPDTRSAPSADTLPDDVAKRFVEFFDKLTRIVVENQSDCAKMAAGVNTHVDTHEALLKQITDAKAQNKSLPPADKEKIAKKSAEELAPAMMKKCSNDRPVMTALMRINPRGEKLTPEQERERLRERIEHQKEEERERGGGRK
jgi:hypothetical protein